MSVKIVVECDGPCCAATIEKEWVEKETEESGYKYLSIRAESDCGEFDEDEADWAPVPSIVVSLDGGIYIPAEGWTVRGFETYCPVHSLGPATRAE